MLDEIEADLLRCEAILAGSGAQGSDGGLQHLGSARQQPSVGTRAGARGSQMDRQPPRQQQQQRGGGAARAQAAAPPTEAAAAKPKPKSMADLLAMLEDAPAGPVEIDTALLYSPQSSADLHGSPSGSVVGGGGSWSAAGSVPSPVVLRSGGGGRGGPGSRKQQQTAAQRQQQGGGKRGPAGGAEGAASASPLGEEFSLSAYRPSSGGAADLLADGFGSGLQLEGGGLEGQRQLFGTGLEFGAPGQTCSPGLLSPADSEILLHRLAQPHPMSRGQTQAQAGAQAGRPRSGGAAASRQLKLDDVIAASVQGATAGLLAAGREARLQRLAEPRWELWERCAKQKLDEELQELQECTFAPRVGRPSDPASGRQLSGLPVEERLHRRSEGRAEELQRKRAEQEGEALSQCTFNPQLNQPERHLRREYTPIHRRVAEEQRRRSVKLAQLRALEDLINPEATFSPQLNPRSLQLAAEREERELYSPASGGGGTSQRRSRSALAEAHPDIGACTFSPTLNSASQRLLEDSATVPTDFQERLRFYGMRREAKQRQMQAEQDAADCTFRPDTGNAVEVLAFSERRAGNLLETEAERYERMALEEAARQEARRAAKERELYGGLDFRPQLNPRSLRIAKDRTLEELASAEKAARKIEQLRAEEEERLRRECTFRPNTAKPRVVGYGDEYEAPQPKARFTLAGQGLEGVQERIQEYQAEREARAARARAEAEARQLAECSFTPEINRQPVRAKGPVVIRGLDRFLETKQLAERQKREAEERAAQVFLANPKGPANARTVPQPFQLKGQARLEQRAQAKQSAAVQSALAERMAECTFRPHTNCARRQQALAGILEAEGSEGGRAWT